MSKITVQVTDTLSVAPDTIVLYLSVNYKNKQYNSCFNKGVDLARKKADILARASGLSISGISKIYYNKPDYGNTMYGMRCADMSNSLQSVVGTEMVKPITLSDSVTVVYKTKG